MNFSNKPMIIYFVSKNDEIVYIGQTKQSLAKRKTSHKAKALKGEGSVFGAAIRKHGFDSFVFNKHSIYYNQIDLDAAEKHYIAKYKPRYNVQDGGQKGFTGWNKGKKEERPEVLKRISESAKNRRRSARPNDTLDAKRARADGRIKAYIQSQKPIICHETGKIYKLVVDAARDMNLKANGIYAVLHPKHSMKSYKGYSFSYLE